MTDLPHCSAHADADQITDWMRGAPAPRTTYGGHGEESSCDALRDRIDHAPGRTVVVPGPGEVVLVRRPAPGGRHPLMPRGSLAVRSPRCEAASEGREAHHELHGASGRRGFDAVAASDLLTPAAAVDRSPAPVEEPAMAFARYTVSDVMTKTVVTVTPDAEFKEIAAVMERWKVTAVPVVESGGHVVGIVSEADLLPKEEFHEHGPGMIDPMHRLDDTAKAGSVRAEEMMTSPTVTIEPGASLPQAARLMADRRIKRLPVVDADGNLKGIVSRADLLKIFLRSDDDLAAEIRHEVVDRLFPASHGNVKVSVTRGVATLTGRVREATLIPVAARLAQSVEGVVSVDCRLDSQASAQ
ncbi:CBS domain-containing protein [Streptomyces sp. NPDC056230]|uniref:CBS domain-containing protein n=1 Tax=Streptomyces sp. NPDC056230 TaxID=3345754 RepID=UPI0035E2DD9B